MFGQLLGDVDRQVVLLLGVYHFDGLKLVHQYTGVTYQMCIRDRKDIMQGLVISISSAKKYFYIQTPYFLPTEAVLGAMQTAALSGVCLLYTSRTFRGRSER